MSRTRHESKGPGFDYWKSRLGKWGDDPGPLTKAITRRRERRTGRHILATSLNRGDEPMYPPQEARMG